MSRFLGWIGRALNLLLLIRPSHAACEECGWVHPRSKLTVGLCPKCFEGQTEEEYVAYLEFALERDLEEVDHQLQKEIDAAWEERRAKLDSQPCSFCRHPLNEHAGPDCMVLGCFCTEEYFDRLAEEESEPPREVWFTEPPSGHRGYE